MLEEEEVKEVLEANGLLYRMTSSTQYKILNGFYKNMMYYPTTGSLLVQTGSQHRTLKKAGLLELIEVMIRGFNDDKEK